MMSINTDEMNMVYREDTSSLPPISFHPSRNRGMFRRMTVAPTGMTGNIRLMIWAMPVMPPKAMPLGSKHQT